MKIYDQKLLEVFVNTTLKTVSVNELLQFVTDGYTITLSDNARDELKSLSWLT